MRSAYWISPRLVAALVIAGAILIGWVARTTRAQQGPQASLPAVPSETTKSAPDTPLPFPGPPTDEVAPRIQESPFPAATPSKPESLPPTDLSVPPESSPPNPAGPGNDDPEKNARAFLEQNRKIAQGELRKLKDEADQLRTRLGKVEAGIRRWEALVAALDHSEKPAGLGPVLLPGADHPTDLSPIEVPKRAMAVRESTPTAPPDATPPVLKAGSGETGEATKPAEPPQVPARDASPSRAAGPDLETSRPLPPGPAVEPR